MILAAPRSKHEKGECATGVVRALNADNKVTLDATRLKTALHGPTTPGTLQPFKVTVLGLFLLPVSKHPQYNCQCPRALRPQGRLWSRLCVMTLRTRQIITRTPDNQEILWYNLLPTRDDSASYASHQWMSSFNGPLHTGQSY